MGQCPTCAAGIRFFKEPCKLGNETTRGVEIPHLRCAYLNMEQASNVIHGGIIDIRARCHLSLAGKLSETKVVQLSLEGSKFRMSKVLLQHMAL